MKSRIHEVGLNRKALRSIAVVMTLVFGSTALAPAAMASTLSSTGTDLIPSYSTTFQIPGYLESVTFLEGQPASGTSTGKTYYVSTTGSNSNTGAESSAFKTITYAFSKLKAGDTLYIKEGVYKEDSIATLAASGTSSAYIRIIGLGDVVIDGAAKKASSGTWSPAVSISGKSYIYIENLQFKNSRGLELKSGSHHITVNGMAATDNYYAVDMSDVNNIQIRNAYITRSYFGVRADGDTHDVLMENINVSYSINKEVQADGFQNGDGFIFEDLTYNLTFRKIHTSYNSDAGMDIKGNNVRIENLISHHNTNGLKLWGTNINVVNALIYDQRDQTSPTGTFTAAVGINVRRGATRVYNSTIVGVGSGAEALVKPTTGASLHIENSIVALSSSAGKLRFTHMGTFTEKNVLWYRNGRSTPEFTLASGSLWANPNFVNWSADDYRLTSSSAALNRGVMSAVIPTYDLAMNARVTNSVIDLGAFELVTANRPPVLTVASAQTVSENQPLAFTLQGSDPEGSSLTYSASNLPAGSTFDAAKRLFSWTPSYNQAGTYDVTFRVSDGSLTTTQIVSLTVQNVNRLPVFQSVGDQNGMTGDALLFSVAANDPDGDTLLLGARNLPAGAVFDAQNRIFSWTPGATQAGNYTVTFTANDGKTVVNRDVLIRIAQAPAPAPEPTPVPTPTPSPTPIEGATIYDAQNYAYASGTVYTYDPGVLTMYSARTVRYDIQATEAADYTFHLSTMQVTSKLVPTADYQFSIQLSVDGKVIGAYDMAALKAFTQSQEINLGKLTSGAHVLELKWMNDILSETGDSNLGIRDLVLTKVTPAPLPTEYQPVSTLNAQMYTSVSAPVFVFEPAAVGMYGNRELTYDMSLTDSGSYGLSFATMQISSKKAPAGYQFKIAVLVDGRLIGNLDFAAEKVFTMSDVIDLGVLSAGQHELKLVWFNDTLLETGEDSNLGLRDLVIQKKEHVMPAEPPVVVETISALDFASSTGPVIEQSQEVLTSYGSQTIHYTITTPLLKDYLLKFSTAQTTRKTVPDGYRFQLNIYVDNTLVASYDADALKTFTESDLIDLGVLSAGTHDLAIEWTNDLHLSETIDTNLGIKDLEILS